MRSALLGYFEGRVEHYRASGSLRIRTGDGGHTVYPGLRYVERLRAGEPVAVPAFCLRAACRAAGHTPPPIHASAWVTVAADGAVTPL